MGDLEAAVLRSNRGRCVACNVPAERVDHVKPRHAGGLTVPENLLPLCDWCNKTKSCMWPGHGYHPWRGHDDPQAAVSILMREAEYLEGIYGASSLTEALRPFHEAVLEERGQRRDAWRYRYFHLTDALYAELGGRAFECWRTSHRSWDWIRQYA
jgi:hypothetical protein